MYIYIYRGPGFVHHYDDVIMGTMASQITSLTIVYSTVNSGADQSKHQSSASLAFVWGIHRGPVNSPHKWPVTRKMFPFDGVIMSLHLCWNWWNHFRSCFYWMELEQLECVLRIPPAAPWLPILLIHIGSQVKTRQSQSYEFKEFAKT